MKSVVKFLSVVILFLSTSLSAQRIYKMSIKNDTLFIESVDSTPKTGIIINTDSTPMFEFYTPSSKVVLGTEDRSTDDIITKYMNMNDGDTKISDRLKSNIDGDCVEFFYYSNTFITNYFTPQRLDKVDYVLQIKDKTKTLKYTIKNGKICLSVYPNPVKNGNLYITSDSNNAKSVAVYDILGKQVLNAKTSNNSVNVSNLKGGAYIVRITEEGKTDYKKIIILNN